MGVLSMSPDNSKSVCGNALVILHDTFTVTDLGILGEEKI